jgi:Flp pilus assembly protein TadG
MRPKLPQRARGDEAGATLIIVVLSLLALFGMMVLVVDVGSVLFVRRELVNSADAAALAAAQSCSKKEGGAVANAQATYYATANKAGAFIAGGYPQYWPRCDAPAGLVTVRVKVDTPLFFAPVLGADSTTGVTTQATAVWGGAGAGEKVAPLMLSMDRLGTCQIPPPNPDDYPEGKECWFWWNNSSRGGHTDPDLANAEWGTLDLLNWDILPSVHCNNSTPPQFETWMLRGFPLPLPIDSDFYGGVEEDTHTYVCRGQGHFGAALDNDIEQVIAQNEPLYFPVNRPSTQIDATPQDPVGVTCAPADYAVTGCMVDKYDVVGFAYMYIEALYKGNQLDAEATENCVTRLGVDPDPNARCMKTRWIKFTNEGLIPREGENFGVVPVALIE